MGSFFGFDPFRNFYGTEDNPEVPGGRQISAEWQSGIQNGTQVGSIIGLWLNGILSDRFGYRKTMLGSLVLMIAFIFLPFFAQNVETLLAGAILCGLPWGVFQTITVTYASDITPTCLRPIMTSYVNLCWVIGQFIAAGVLRGMNGREDQWSYRIPFAIQWIWPPIIIIGVIFAPESPWWLVRHNRLEDAKKAILSLTRADSGIPFDADQQVSMIKQTNDLEFAMTEGTQYTDCFRGFDLRRTEITCMVWVTQAFCGAALMGYSVQFYQRAGLDQEDSLNFNLGQYAMGAVGTILSWFLMPHIGRRALYLWGLAALCILLVIVGGMGVAGTASWNTVDDLHLHLRLHRRPSLLLIGG
jgi:MFS transporter, SP family, general alpha glucoside:H+ symporter